MNSKESLAILTAMKKVIDARIKDIRKDVDTEMWDGLEAEGIEKKALMLDGKKVGEVIMTYAADGYSITDEDAFIEFALNYGLASVERVVKPECMPGAVKFLREYLSDEEFNNVTEDKVTIVGDWETLMTGKGAAVTYLDSGMVVPGVEYRPKYAKSTMVRGCAPEDVLPIVAQLPGGVDKLLLGDEKEAASESE